VGLGEWAGRDARPGGNVEAAKEAGARGSRGGLGGGLVRAEPREGRAVLPLWIVG